MNSNETDFEDVSKERPSQVWKYFLFNKKTEYGKCKLCPKFKQLKAKGGGSKGLKDHLFLVHKIKIETVAENCQASSPAKKSKISGHFKPVYDFSKVMKYEFSAFEQSGKRSETLENLYEALCTVPPTSVESERAFSTVGLFATKIRSSLADNSIDALLTLRVYFKKQQK